MVRKQKRLELEKGEPEMSSSIPFTLIVGAVCC